MEAPMKRTFVAFLGLVASAVLSLYSGAGAHTAAFQGDQYMFIDAQTTRSRLARTISFERVRDRLMDAADKGYGVQAMAVFSSSANVLLKRGGPGPGSYRFVATSGEGAFLNELNQTASLGFRVVSEGIKAIVEGGTFGSQTTWLAVLVKHEDAPRTKYSVVKGTTEGEVALADSPKAGQALVGILGRQGMVAANTLLFFEDSSGGVPPPSEQREYRIVATARTSALQNDLTKAAAEGFRVVGAGSGHMTVVMARAGGSTPTPIAYRVIAMVRVETAVKELQAAAAEGFRVAAITENGQEGVFVLHRRPDTSDRFEYRLTRLQEATASQTLIDAEADGYRIIRLLSDLVLLERGL
jgi:hypothetical protein